MRRTIIKWFWLWDFDKEEKWLNEMSAQGLQLVSVGYCRYVFEEGLRGEYSYRLELLNNLPNHAESLQYIQFLEDTKADYIGNVMRWVYFKKQVSDGVFDLFSDIDSRIKHLNRLSLLILPFFIMQLAFGVNKFSLYINHKMEEGNLFIGGVCLLLAIWLGYGYLIIFFKKRKLKKERFLYE